MTNISPQFLHAMGVASILTGLTLITLGWLMEKA